MRATKRSRRQKKRRGTYLLGTLILIIIVAIGWYAYASSQPPNTKPPAEIVYAKINTSKGVIEVELYQKLTPKTVDNFVSLANSHFYDNLVWHRIEKPFVIQTGDPYSRNGGNRESWGQGKSSQTVPLEIDSSLHNDAYTLGMASVTGELATSQFYINLSDNRRLDGSYAVFGKVISGMGVVDTIADLPVNSSNQPIDPSQAMMTSVTILSSP